jgi:hypothetical protein
VPPGASWVAMTYRRGTPRPNHPAPAAHQCRGGAPLPARSAERLGLPAGAGRDPLSAPQRAGHQRRGAHPHPRRAGAAPRRSTAALRRRRREQPRARAATVQADRRHGTRPPPGRGPRGGVGYRDHRWGQVRVVRGRPRGAGAAPLGTSPTMSVELRLGGCKGSASREVSRLDSARPTPRAPR